MAKVTPSDHFWSVKLWNRNTSKIGQATERYCCKTRPGLCASTLLSEALLLLIGSSFADTSFPCFETGCSEKGSFAGNTLHQSLTCAARFFPQKL